ncbi:MAG: EthD domain-containing protein [Caulobacter sp.]|nr:EthD domain-containing protein [Caulobacter sp.]
MIKLTFCLTRRADFTRDAFQAYWRDTHAPLVASVKDALRIRRYVQMHSFPLEISADTRASRGGPEGYDGVAELWWDSFDDLAANADNPAARAAGRLLLDDEKRFIDLTRSPLWWGEEQVVF